MEACKTHFVKKFNREANARVLAKTKRILKESKQENKQKRVFTAILKQLQTKPSKEEIAFETKMTIQKYCNPGCKGTVYQDTPHSKTDLEKMFETYGKHKERIIANFRKSAKKMRKTMKDGFYYKLNKAKLIKDGAISGCTRD
jgi:hypothetical protein